MEALIEYSPSLLAGAWVTLQIALLSVLLAVATGLLGAACKLSGFLPLRLLDHARTPPSCAGFRTW